MSTSQRILQNAHIHRRILTSVDELNYVPSALHLHMVRLGEIQARHGQSEARLKSLSELSRRKYKKLQKLRNSSTQKVAYKLVGLKDKLSEKEDRRKREHQEALEQELAQRDCHGVVSQQLADASRVKRELEAKSQQLQSLKEELGQLYSRIFDGPTPEFPEDDRLEHHLQVSQSLHDKLLYKWNGERQVEDILTAADQKISQCKDKMDEALRWGGGTIGGRYMLIALREAQSFAERADELCQQAHKISSLVQPIEKLSPTQTDLVRVVTLNREELEYPEPGVEHPSPLHAALAPPSSDPPTEDYESPCVSTLLECQ